MRNVLLVLTVILFLSANVKEDNNAQEEKNELTLEFLVIDAFTEEPIPAARIILQHNQVESYTDLNGIARIKNIEAGSYDIEISFVSYKKKQLKSHNIDIGNRKITVKLNP